MLRGRLRSLTGHVQGGFHVVQMHRAGSRFSWYPFACGAQGFERANEKVVLPKVFSQGLGQIAAEMFLLGWRSAGTQTSPKRKVLRALLVTEPQNP